MKLIPLLILLLVVNVAAAEEPINPPIDASEFRAWLAEQRAAAKAKGVGEVYLKLLDGLAPNEKIRELASRQAEYVKPMWDYLDLMITDERLRLGRAALSRHAEFLGELEAKYGVPREILVAIWGVETNYGSNKGSFSVLQALATLGFEGTRAKFGRQQLGAALSILQDGDIAPSEMLGSWAGAMGHTQFIPTTYQAYAVDGTGDGKRDIWNEPHDALASAANYLKVSGWRRDLIWGFEVSLPPDFDYAQATIKNVKPARYWRSQGVKSLDENRIADALGDVSIFVPSGASNPVFLVTRNFRALLRYNTAPAYALAVGRLSLRFYGEVPLHKNWAVDARPMQSSEIKSLQRGLAAAGYEIGKIDGILGRRTRAAVRDYQAKRGLRADGYATPALLQYMQKRKSQ